MSIKILYLMHIDWNWIKQRPHFIAEYLAKNDCTVEIYYNYDSGNALVHNSTDIKTVRPVPRFRGARFLFIKKLNAILYYFFAKRLMRKNHYDYIFFTHPMMYTKSLKGCFLYDCMDDNISFSISLNERNIILKKEQYLMKNAYAVFFSSHYLADIIMRRYNFAPSRYAIINNAIELPSGFLSRTITKGNKKDLILTYIGTVSDWFDFTLLEEVRERFIEKNIIYNLYGPVQLSVRNKNFNFLGSIEHDAIFEVMEHSDILIMPFIVTELIKSVNPVKLYEYIYSGKPVISVRYGETECFEKYVYLYEQQDVESFLLQINLALQNNLHGKAPLEDAVKFVQDNTWEYRIKQILNIWNTK